jgi:O-antigen ligase
VRQWFAVRADLRDQSGSVRQIIWNESWKMLEEHPVFGAGLSGYPGTIPPYHEATYIEIFQYPHDLFLNFWSEMGLAGLAAFLWILGLAVFTAWRRLATRPNEAWLVAAVIGALAAIFVHGLVDVPYFKNDLAMMVWLIISLVAAPTVAAKPNQNASNQASRIAG